MSPNNNTTLNNTEDGYPRAGHLVRLGIDVSAANDAAVVNSVVVTSAASTVFPFAVLEGHVLDDQGVAMFASPVKDVFDYQDMPVLVGRGTTVHDVSESYDLEDGQLDSDPFGYDAVPMLALHQVLVKTCYDVDDSDDDGQDDMVLLTPTAFDNYQFDTEFPLPTVPRHSFADTYSGYSYDTAKDNHYVQPKSVVPFDDLYQDFNTDPIDPAVDYSVFPPLSPSTLRQLEEFLAANGAALSPTTACVDPALLGFDVSVPQASWADATLQSLNDLFNLPVVAQPTPLAHIDNSDINTAVNLVDSDTESTTSTDSDDESCNIETNDIVRHVWRGPNLRYTFHHNGERLTLSADQMDMRFSGVKSALWGYWRTKSAKRMNQQKLFAYFKRNGVAGFFSEMLWHLLPDVIHYQLIALRRKNRLHEWKW